MIFIGGNDFIQALHSSSPAEHLRGRGERAAANVGRALETLLAASPAAKVLLITVPDLADLPEFREKIRAGVLNRSVWDQAAAELEGFNSRIRRMGVARGRVAVLDFAADLPGFDAGLSPKYLQVAGRKVDRTRAGNDPECLFLGDVRHLGTVGQGMLAKAIVASLNARFDAGIAPLEDREILAIASNPARPEGVKDVAATMP